MATQGNSICLRNGWTLEEDVNVSMLLARLQKIFEARDRPTKPQQISRVISYLIFWSRGIWLRQFPVPFQLVKMFTVSWLKKMHSMRPLVE